ncbi:MAG: hypothetical protein IPQ07_25100 [Myxococcales bacterium]|nr:hypothetical protein [Myxococcales bacterium]
MSGTGTVDIDLRVPVSAGVLDWHGAEGHVDLGCGPCRLGDDHARIRPNTRNPRIAAMVGDGIEFGHLDIDDAHVAIRIGHGTADVTAWKVSSRDLEIKLALAVELAPALDDAKLVGCLRFRETESLTTRAPKTATVIVATGAGRGADGLFNIRLAGTVGALRMQSQICDGSVPLPADDPPPATQPADGSPPTVADDPAADDDVTALIARTIHRVDDVTYKLDRALIDRLLANPMVFAKGARVVPSVKNGKPSGFRLYAIRPGSLFAALGLTNGDTLLSVNGFELTSADRALEVYTKIRDASALEIEIERRGKRLTLRYAIE